MALTFSLVATAAAFGGHWVVRLNQGGRYVAIAIFFVLGLTLLFPSLAEALTRPLVQAGAKLQGGPSSETSVGKSFLLGVSTGLLWTPCAGPISLFGKKGAVEDRTFEIDFLDPGVEAFAFAFG
jgi:cytochrome c biogenesis protein CcdA